MNTVSINVPSTSQPIAKLITRLLRFTDIEFRALLETASLTHIERIRTTLTQGREKLAGSNQTDLAIKAMTRIDELITIIDTPN